ncbi:Ribulose-5-phosphate 4-epimerase-related epimerase and aldolase [Archaeoglobus sulfaticallidus PM70-1]|uniref:Ribulose-5-phosphate 4-epimerase-related epimerase and aldolase n=1 Tax=Archaeoglobus sulfaticallidus PM70-1 TaxID=387631 RepID=N0BMW2_9EURY|nr:class II aldolase/adducin family protein [Archaeoglobus sulfaticallidus]AGK61951.1 Ribulose-5-phosphate 4-epimerase-related epimerase and aldolase [Archaeoglobus sulfaticallidus PM70-1]
MFEEAVFEEAALYGRKLYERGLIDGASGNLSFKDGDYVFITKTGVNLYDLTKESFVKVRIDADAEKLKALSASSDALLHIKAYQKSDYSVILHCHGTYNVVLSLIYDKIVPVDLEGKLFLGEIEVIDASFMTEEYAEMVSDGIAKKGFAVVKGHGIYCAGKTFREVFNVIEYIEHSCQVLYLARLVGL